MERTAFILYLIVLIWSPLAFGAVHTGAYTFMTIGVLGASLLLAASEITKDRSRGAVRFTVPATSLDLLFLLLLFFLLFQTLPLPSPVVEFLSPGAWVAGHKSLPASLVVMGQGPQNPWFSLAPYTAPVLMSLVRWVTYGLFFLGFSRTLNTRSKIEKAVFAVLILGCFESLYGLIQTYSGHDHIWWYKKVAYRGSVTGTFVNRNHFAGLMEMIVMLAAVYAAAISEKKGRRDRPRARKTYLRARLAKWLSGEQRFNKRAFVLFFGVVSGIGLIFSASRGGIIGAAGGLLCAGLFFLLRQGHRIKGLLILLLFAVISVYSLLIGAEYTAARFNYFEADMKTRERYAQRGLMIFRDYPLAGVGVGNFPFAYPKFQAAEDRKAGIVYAHNDWVQFLSEGGTLGFCLFLAGMTCYLFRSVRLWRTRRDPFSVCLGIAPFAAFAAIGIHSWVDFNLHIPANFLMLSAVTAIGYSALHIESHSHQERSFYPVKSVALRWKGLSLLVALVGLILWCGLSAMRHLQAEAAYRETLASSRTVGNLGLERLRDAVGAEPGNALYRFDLGLAFRKERDARILEPGLGDEGRRALQLKVLRTLERAVRLNPFRGEYHIRLAWEYTYLWREADARERWIPAADLSMERAAFFAGENNPFLHIMMGDYWLMRSKTVSPATTQWETCLAKARWHYRKNLSLETGSDRKRMLEHIRRNVWVHYPDDSFVQRLTQ